MHQLLKDLASYPIHALILGACLSVALASLGTHIVLAAGLVRSRLLPGVLLGLQALAISYGVQWILAHILAAAPHDVVFLVALLPPAAVPMVVLTTSAHAALALQDAADARRRHVRG